VSERFEPSRAANESLERAIDRDNRPLDGGLRPESRESGETSSQSIFRALLVCVSRFPSFRSSSRGNPEEPRFPPIDRVGRIPIAEARNRSLSESVIAIGNPNVCAMAIVYAALYRGRAQGPTLPCRRATLVASEIEFSKKIALLLTRAEPKECG